MVNFYYAVKKKVMKMLPEKMVLFISNLIHLRYIQLFNESIRICVNKKRLINKSFSLFSSNCNGGMVYHLCGQQFRSPFINLYFEGNDYIKVLSDLKRYMSEPLVFYEKEGIDFPVARLGDVSVYFMHYASEHEARCKWEERVKRINYDNIFIMLSIDTRSENMDIIKRFDNLPYRKVILSDKRYAGIKSSFACKHYREEPNNYSNLSMWVNGWSGKRVIDDFDYVNWLNTGDINDK